MVVGQRDASFPEFKARDNTLKSWSMRSDHSGPLALSLMGAYSRRGSLDHVAEGQPLLVRWVKQWPPGDISTWNL